MLVREVMTTPVLSVPENASVVDALQLMLEQKISGLPVVAEGNRVVGIVTEGDFLRRLELGTEAKHSRWVELFKSVGSLAGEYIQASSRRVADIMSRKLVTIGADAPLDDLVALMIDRKIKRVPVVEGGKMVGIVSRADLLRVVFRTLTADAARAPKSDEEIRRAILHALQGQSWIGASLIQVSVRDAVVTLTGTISHENQRNGARVAAESVPGVVKVIERLGMIEPLSGTYIPPLDEI